MYWWGGLSIFFGLAAVAWVVLRGPFGLPRHGLFRLAPLAIALVPVVVLTPLWIMRTRWIRRALRGSEGRLCTHCGYDVSRLAHAGVCPECGRAYDITADRRLWENVGARYGDPLESEEATSIRRSASGD